MTKDPYQQVKDFHQTFDPPVNQKPTPFSKEEALFRASFKIEELVEFLYSTSNNEEKTFLELTEKLKDSINQAVAKIKTKEKPVLDPLTEQVDALTDLLYLTYGSFVLMGVDPRPIFNVVHDANMGKLFPDGKPHHDPVTHKILKPDDWEEKYAPEGKIRALIDQQSFLSNIE